MKLAILTSKIDGSQKRVHATLRHPSSTMGCPVWVGDDDGLAYMQVGMAHPMYDVHVTGDAPHLLIAEVLTEKGLTQSEIAKRMGITRGTFSNAIKHNDARLTWLARVATAIGCDIKDLFE